MFVYSSCLRSIDDNRRVGYLLAAGKSDREIAEATGIPRRTIWDWRHGRNQARNRTRHTTHLRYACADNHDFAELPALPYVYLLGLYLGDGCISKNRRGVWCMRIALDAAYPGIVRECQSALEAIFPSKQARVAERRDCRCIDVSMWSKHWPCLIPQHGPGRKHLRSIALTGWQTEVVEAQRKAFLRGLIHSDGTRVIATERKGNYVRRAPRYAFSNKSEDIKRLFCESCDSLGIRWTRPCDRQIAIYRKASVAILDEFIGPKR